jgi:hypothetical protein
MLEWLCQQGREDRDRKEWRDGRGCGYRPSDRKLRLLGCAAWRQHHERRDLRLVEAAEEWADGKIDRETAVCRVAGLAPREPHYTLLQPSAYYAAGNAEVNCRDKALFSALVREIVGNPFQRVALPDKECWDCGGYGNNLGAGPDRGNPECDTCRGTGGLPDCPWLTPTVISLATAAYEERERVCARCKGEKRVPAYSGMYRLGSDPCEDCCGTGRLEDGLLDCHRLAVLADALEEAGCAEESLLRHLRGDQWCRDCQGTGRLKYNTTTDNDPTCWFEHTCHFCEGCGWAASVYCPVRSVHVRGCWALDLLLGKE